MTKQVIELRAGMLGWSAEAIAINESGYCYFPLGEKDETYPGGRVWVKVRVTAAEDIREERDVIVADEEHNVKEHTPVELSYERAVGGFQRVTEVYPLPIVVYFDKNGVAQKVGLAEPLPVTAGSKAITYVTVAMTAVGNTLLVAPSSATLRIRVHYFAFSNAHAANADVGLRFTATGAVRHRTFLAANGGNVNANLIDGNWQGALGESLFAWALAAYAGGIYVTIGYTEEV